jgi:hypothetical protein
MRMTSCALAALALLTASAASAQTVNLTGTYICVEACRVGPAGAPAFITQNGWDLNLLNEAGQSSRASPDVTAPATRIWADAWNEGAVYSPDGMTIQFDNGTVWQRDMGPPPPPPVRVVHVRTSKAPATHRHHAAATHPKAAKSKA